MVDTSGPTTALPDYTQIVGDVVTALPLVISPIVAWVLGRSRVSRESGIIDYSNKRLDFLERMSTLQAQFAEGAMKPVVQTEIEHCQEFLRQPPALRLL